MMNQEEQVFNSLNWGYSTKAEGFILAGLFDDADETYGECRSPSFRRFDAIIPCVGWSAEIGQGKRGGNGYLSYFKLKERMYES